jgi:hypothetical protein
MRENKSYENAVEQQKEIKMQNKICQGSSW